MKNSKKINTLGKLTGALILYLIMFNVYSQNPRDLWDTQFLFTLNNSFAGLESDGEYLYASNLDTNVFTKFDVNGNIVDYFSIPGIPNIASFTYDGQYYYGIEYGVQSNQIYVMDFNNRILVDIIVTPDILPISLTYDNDLDVFYSTMHYGDIAMFNKNGDKLDEFIIPDEPYVYHLAYDGWTEGGPYLYFMTFTSLPGDDMILKQYSLTTREYTGLSKDLSYLGGFAQGQQIFTTENLIDGTVTLGGRMLGGIIYGLELDSLMFECNPPINLDAEISGADVILTWETPISTSVEVSGYNIYRNNIVLNTSLIQDTYYTDGSLDPGTYVYNITAVYKNPNGEVICESTPDGPVELEFIPPSLILGGNVFIGNDKLTDGTVTTYVVDDNSITQQQTVDIIDTLGYYYFFPFDNNEYYIQAFPNIQTRDNSSLIPTYYGNSIHWENAIPVFLEQDIVDADIYMKSKVSISSGNGEIKGNVQYEDPFLGKYIASNIPVYLLSNTNECIKVENTNILGEFSMSSLPYGTYKIIVELVGKKMSPAIFVLNNENPIIDNIEFIISEDEILFGINGVLPNYIDYMGDIFPNPSRGTIRYNIRTNKTTLIKTKITDIIGNVLYNITTELTPGINSIDIDINGINNGLYFCQIDFIDGFTISKKIILTK